MLRRALAAPLAALALAAAMPAGVRAAAPDAAPAESPQQRLYQQALQALAEGRRTDASDVLRRLIEQEPQHAGAWLDLALIQCSLGNAEEAERLFANVETRFAPSRDILELIAQTREEGCRPWSAASSLAVSLGRGVDRNVNQGASTATLRVEGTAVELPLLDDFLPKRDGYTTGSLDYLRDLTPNGTLGFAQLQWRRNDRLHGYDTMSLFGGVESLYRFGGWGVRATGIAGMVSLGGSLYQRQGQGQLRLAPPLPLPGKVTLDLMGGVTCSDYKRLINFDSRAFELRPELSYRSATAYAGINYGLLSDRGNDARPGGNRHGQLINLQLRRSLFKDGVGELAYSRQTWRGDRAYAPELLLPQIRDQATQVLRAALTYRIDKRHSLQLEARAVRNRENIPIFQYNNRQLQLSWQWQP